MNSLPKISVVTITYGHQDYITETLDGVFMQQYDGPIEFIIANDNSPDNTDQVIKDYLATHKIPENFEVKYTKHPQNMGMMPNFIWALNQATTSYIALCEGDDYWTDPLKIKKQIDFLEKNLDYALVCTQCNTTTENRSELQDRKEVSPQDILHHNPISTLTTVFRNDKKIIDNLNSNFLLIGDYQLWLEFAIRHKIMKLADNTAFYRILSNSASGRNDYKKAVEFEKTILLITEKYLSYFDLKPSERNSILSERYSYVISKSQQRKLYKQIIYLIGFFWKYRYFDINLVKQIASKFLRYT